MTGETEMLNAEEADEDTRQMWRWRRREGVGRVSGSQ
jgi:hypothetical protein